MRLQNNSEPFSHWKCISVSPWEAMPFQPVGGPQTRCDPLLGAVLGEPGASDHWGRVLWERWGCETTVSPDPSDRLGHKPSMSDRCISWIKVGGQFPGSEWRDITSPAGSTSLSFSGCPETFSGPSSKRPAFLDVTWLGVIPASWIIMEVALLAVQPLSSLPGVPASWALACLHTTWRGETWY